ncbi:hypothetical protein GS745_22590 [Rhodococcus hoagii]|nr:hypothetical protein [Prescottella equi]
MLNSVDVIDVLDPMPRLVPVGDAAGRFVQWRDGRVHLLDDRLSEIARRDLPLADESVSLRHPASIGSCSTSPAGSPSRATK